MASGTALAGALVLLDCGTGHLATERTEGWAALALLLMVVLTPAQVAAGEGWITSRRLLRTHRVRTDELVSIRVHMDGVAHRWVLRDARGGRVQIDPRRLLANPVMWHMLERGARDSAARGLLTCGATAVEQLARRVDEACKGILHASEL
ncbi:hypothetical protein ACIRO1_23710 [Streptomyces sp. NPDC102381]|uniref:hypothetical protein n=1 Tax=Streptomyces sp. NPDC102381 TaxID=3366164 RepID=UPI00381D54B1